MFYDFKVLVALVADAFKATCPDKVTLASVLAARVRTSSAYPFCSCQLNRLTTVRAYRYDYYRHAELFLDKSYIIHKRLRKIRQADQSSSREE